MYTAPEDIDSVENILQRNAKGRDGTTGGRRPESFSKKESEPSDSWPDSAAPERQEVKVTPNRVLWSAVSSEPLSGSALGVVL